jgi:hypothetical protein
MLELYLLIQKLSAVQKRRSTSAGGRSRWPEVLSLYFEAMEPGWQKRFCVVGRGAEPQSLSVAEVRAVHGACSQQSEYAACRAAGSMMVPKPQAWEQLGNHRARWLDLQECHEGYCRLRSPLRSRRLPCCSGGAARGEGVDVDWPRSTPPQQAGQ